MGFIKVGQEFYVHFRNSGRDVEVYFSVSNCAPDLHRQSSIVSKARNGARADKSQQNNLPSKKHHNLETYHMQFLDIINIRPATSSFHDDITTPKLCRSFAALKITAFWKDESRAYLIVTGKEKVFCSALVACWSLQSGGSPLPVKRWQAVIPSWENKTSAARKREHLWKTP